MLTVKNVSYSYGQQSVLNSISFELEQGSIVGLLGLSGSGKTTLLKLLSGLLEPNQGSITLDGHIPRLNGKRNRNFASDLGVVFQQFNLFMHLSVVDNVALAYRLRTKVSKKEARQKALEHLTSLGLADQADKFPDQCSGGQQQRIAIARALILSPRILLIDEPTSSLDKENTKILIKLLKELHVKGLTLVLITHDLDFAKALCERVIELDTGSICFDGSAQDYFKGER